jgi:hypothetical protein
MGLKIEGDEQISENKFHRYLPMPRANRPAPSKNNFNPVQPIGITFHLTFK